DRAANLPVGAAVVQDGPPAIADKNSRRRVGLASWQSKPEDVEGRRRAHGLQPRQGPNARKPTIGRDHQLRSRLVPPVFGSVAHSAAVPILVLQKSLDTTAHDQAESGAAPTL